MPKDIRKGISSLSIDSDETVRRTGKTKEEDGARWIYGFRFKNKHAREIATKLGLSWENSPLEAVYRADTYIAALSGSTYRIDTINRRTNYSTARIMYFAEDDGRMRLDNVVNNTEVIDKVREALGYPEGTKPKWYCCHGWGDTNDSSDDEAWPGISAASSRPLPASVDPEDSSDDSAIEGNDQNMV